MRRNRRKRKLRIDRILSLGCFVSAMIVLSSYFYDMNQQKIYDCMLKTTVAQTQLTEEQINNMGNQNVPVPEEIMQQIQEKQAKEKEEQERIAKEKAKIEEEKRKQVTSRGNTPRTETVTGTKAEYQAYAHDLCINTYGWSEYDFECLVKLWEKESNWNPNAHNKSSGAHRYSTEPSCK